MTDQPQEANKPCRTGSGQRYLSHSNLLQRATAYGRLPLAASQLDFVATAEGVSVFRRRQTADTAATAAERDKPVGKPRVGTLEAVGQLLQELQQTPLSAYLRSRVNAESVEAEVPNRIAEIEINDTCNIDCVMCNTSLASRKKGTMALDLFEKIVSLLSARGMRAFNLHTIGDPLANPKLADYLAILRNYGCTTRISSNCLLLERHMETLLEYRDVVLLLRASIDAASKHVYEKIRLGGKWEVLHRALIAFATRNAQEKDPLPVAVSNVVNADNFHEIAFIPLVFSYLAPPERFKFHFMNSLSPTNDYFLATNYFGDDFTQNAPCPTVFDSIYVLKDGGLTTCCRDYHGELVFGNLRSDTLEQAYNNDTCKQVRRAHLDGAIEQMPKICQSCYIVDPRLSDLLNRIYQYYTRQIQGHPAELQNALNKIGPLLKQRAFTQVLDVVQAL